MAAGRWKIVQRTSGPCLRTFLPMWRVARETKRHEVWLATNPTRPERSDWTLDLGKRSALQTSAHFIRSTYTTDLPLDRRTGLPPPSSLFQGSVHPGVVRQIRHNRAESASANVIQSRKPPGPADIVAVFSLATCISDFHSLTITLSTLTLLAAQSRHNLYKLCSAWLGTPSFLAKYLRCICLD